MKIKQVDLTEHYKILVDPSAQRIPGKIYGMEGSDLSPAEWADCIIQLEEKRLAHINQYLANVSTPPDGYKWELEMEGDLLVDVAKAIDGTKWILNSNHPAFLIEMEDPNKQYKSYDREEAFKLWEENTFRPSINTIFKTIYRFKIEELFKI